MEPAVGIVLSPPQAVSTAHQKLLTPSRAEHGPGGAFIFNLADTLTSIVHGAWQRAIGTECRGGWCQTCLTSLTRAHALRSGTARIRDVEA